MKTVDNKQYGISKEAIDIAFDLIETEDVFKNSYIKYANISFIEVYPHISKVVAGRCYRANKHVKFFNDIDYIIEVSGDLWNGLSDDIKRILILHELMHIHVEYNDKKQKLVYKLKDHDVKDFHYIISKYGIDWLSKLKAEMSSIFDMNPHDENKITL